MIKTKNESLTFMFNLNKINVIPPRRSINEFPGFNQQKFKIYSDKSNINLNNKLNIISSKTRFNTNFSIKINNKTLLVNKFFLIKKNNLLIINSQKNDILFFNIKKIYLDSVLDEYCMWDSPLFLTEYSKKFFDTSIDNVGEITLMFSTNVRSNNPLSIHNFIPVYNINADNIKRYHKTKNSFIKFKFFESLNTSGKHFYDFEPSYCPKGKDIQKNKIDYICRSNSGFTIIKNLKRVMYANNKKQIINFNNGFKIKYKSKTLDLTKFSIWFTSNSGSKPIIHIALGNNTMFKSVIGGMYTYNDDFTVLNMSHIEINPTENFYKYFDIPSSNRNSTFGLFDLNFELDTISTYDDSSFPQEQNIILPSERVINNRKKAIRNTRKDRGCEEGYVLDCSNQDWCIPVEWVGDGYCDNMFIIENDAVISADLSCYSLNIDGNVVDINDPSAISGPDGGDCFSDFPWTPLFFTIKNSSAYVGEQNFVGEQGSVESFYAVASDSCNITPWFLKAYTNSIYGPRDLFWDENNHTLDADPNWIHMTGIYSTCYSRITDNNGIKMMVDIAKGAGKAGFYALSTSGSCNSSCGNGNNIKYCIGNNTRISLNDSYGDGWNGNTLTISGNGKSYNYGLSSGSKSVECETIPPGTYSITCNGGTWQQEVGWEIYDVNGLILSGGSPYNGTLVIKSKELFTESDDQDQEDDCGPNEGNNEGATCEQNCYCYHSDNGPTGCQGTGGNWLGRGCSDLYSTSLNFAANIPRQTCKAARGVFLQTNTNGNRNSRINLNIADDIDISNLRFFWQRWYIYPNVPAYLPHELLYSGNDGSLQYLGYNGCKPKNFKFITQNIFESNVGNSATEISQIDPTDGIETSIGSICILDLLWDNESDIPQLNYKSLTEISSNEYEYYSEHLTYYNEKPIYKPPNYGTYQEFANAGYDSISGNGVAMANQGGPILFSDTVVGCIRIASSAKQINGQWIYTYNILNHDFDPQISKIIIPCPKSTSNHKIYVNIYNELTNQWSDSTGYSWAGIYENNKNIFKVINEDGEEIQYNDPDPTGLEFSDNITTLGWGTVSVIQFQSKSPPVKGDINLYNHITIEGINSNLQEKYGMGSRIENIEDGKYKLIMLGVVPQYDGCIDSNAKNYNENANTDDGSCEYINDCDNCKTLYVGWNLIGGLETDFSINDPNNIIITGTIYSFINSQYISVSNNILSKFTGYWIKAESEGEIEFIALP